MATIFSSQLQYELLIKDGGRSGLGVANADATDAAAALAAHTGEAAAATTAPDHDEALAAELQGHDSVEGVVERFKYPEDLEFERAVNFCYPAIRDALCLEVQEAATALDTSGTYLVSLSFDDWFRLRGLLFSARFGPCDEWFPPWWNTKATRRWEAWKAQGELSAKEARLRFREAVSALPGYRTAAIWEGLSNGLEPATCCQCGATAVKALVRCLSSALEGIGRGVIGRGVVVGRRSQRRAAENLIPELAMGPKRGTLESLVGHWKNVETVGLDPYLKHMGELACSRGPALTSRTCLAYFGCQRHTLLWMSETHPTLDVRDTRTRTLLPLLFPRAPTDPPRGAQE